MTNGTTRTTTDYLDGFQYKNDMLQFFPHTEGYVNVLSKGDITHGTFQNAYDYVFNYTDHLGNIRLSYTDANRDGIIASFEDEYCVETNPLGGCNAYGYRYVREVLEENHYYPFGLKHRNYNTQLSKYEKDPVDDDKRRPFEAVTLDYKYKYNGKELQDELGLNVYDMDMRQYDPAIARWTVMDPVVHHSMSPYNSFDNNPVFGQIRVEQIQFITLILVNM